MQFIYPQILWALLALAIPIIIHLFHFRRFKRVYFTNVKFLKEIKEEKSTRNKLRNLLVLLCRLLAFMFLVFAFAQPFISRNESTKSGKNYVSIFIDNSNSMMASGEDVNLLDRAKSKAEQIINAYSTGDEFQILSHEMKASQRRWLNKENIVQAIEEIELNPEISALSNVYNTQKQTFPGEGNHIVYYLSDFQKSITDFDVEMDTVSELNLLNFRSVKENNIAIDSVWFESIVPALSQNNKMYVRVRNYGKDRKEGLRISVDHNGQVRPVGTIDLEAGETVTDTMNLFISQVGWQNLKVMIDDFPIQFDDSYHVSFNVKDNISVLSINNSESSRYLNALFAGIPQFELDNYNINNIQYDQLSTYDLLILRDLTAIGSGLSTEIKSYVESGGNVIVFPGRNLDTESYNRLLGSINANEIINWNETEKSVFRINTSEFVFSDVFENTNLNLLLPETKGHYSFKNLNSRPGEYLLKYRDGENYITKYSYGKGQLYVCASPLDREYNDLTINAEIFVPLLYKISYSSAQSDQMSYTIGEDKVVNISGVSSIGESIFKITGPSEFIPGQQSIPNATQIIFNDMINEAGIYTLKHGDQTIRQLAFNYDRIESNLDAYSNQELTELYAPSFNIMENTVNADLTNLIKEKDQGITFWRWCLILALLFLALETLLLRFWKV